MPGFNFSPARKRNINKILAFGILIFFFGFVWTLIERGFVGDLDYYPATGIPYDFTTTLFATSLSSLLLGLVIGTVEVLYLNRLFIHAPFGIKIIGKTILYVTTFVLFLFLLSLLYNSLATRNSPFSSEVIGMAISFISTWGFWSVIVYMGATFGIVLFYSEVSDNLGQGVLRNFLTGKYHKPREEERIFMFLDMKSSTTIAEKLGHIRYYDLLNEYYSDVTKAIIQTAGEIYQYVGDEVVVSWKLKAGIKNNNCLRCFYEIKQILRNASDKYRNAYDVVPGFKAGFHLGKVTTGEIGVIKKEIIFTGDVLNTTARIQAMCNTHEVDILVSSDLFSKLKVNGLYSCKEIGECELRGKNKKVRLLTILKDQSDLQKTN